jgi:hypothetical protein
MIGPQKIKVFELRNGNGWMFSINGRDKQPNWDIGETYENQLGFDTKAEALKHARGEVQCRKDWAPAFRAANDWPHSNI